MSNHAYASFWGRNYSEATMLDEFERLLGAVPMSPTQPGFTNLVIRAVSPSETPLIEHDFRGIAAAAPAVIVLAREHLNCDSAYEVEAYWDLWQRKPEDGSWARGPERIVLSCRGESYDEGVASESGHFLVDLGFEHLYTGHAGLLGRGSRSAPADPVEAEFLSWMTHERHLHEYYEKTRENIVQLLDWVRAVEKALPAERTRLWSEGEENLEARLDEILAVH